MKEEEAIRDYFGQPGFQRFIRQLERQYKASKEGARGYVALPDITDHERQTLDSFYRTYSPPPAPGETRRYSVRKFEKLLQDSRFELAIPELLELLRGEPVLTRQEQMQQLNAEWCAMIHSAMEETGLENASSNPIRNWAEGLIDESSPGSRNLRMLFAKSREEAYQSLKICLTALDRIAAQPVAHSKKKLVRLPILAAQVTGDAHALDWKTPSGRLFWWGLTSIQEQPAATFPEEYECDPDQDQDQDQDLLESPLAHSSQAILIREGYRRGGIADDDISSQVMVYAPELFSAREERVLTLRQVEQLPLTIMEAMYSQPIYMVENPSVFAELMDADSYKRDERDEDTECPVIVCGNGQPTTAVVKLLDVLLGMRAGVLLYYSGDMDLAGLNIAKNLQSRYPQAFRAWRMDKELYLRYVHRGIPMSEGERMRLRENHYDWDADLAAVMSDKGNKLHQELWVAELLQDLEEKLSL